MIVRKQRRLVVRMGQYESHEVVGEVTVDTNNADDLSLISEFEDDPTRATAQFLDSTLSEVMYADVEDAHFNTADEDSFIHEYYNGQTKPSKER